MTVKTRKQGDVCKISLEGDVTIYEAAQVYAKLQKQLASACMSFEMDLHAVSELDTAGVQILLSFKREAMATGKNVSLSLHSESVVEVFELFNIAHEFGDPIVLSNRATG